MSENFVDDVKNKKYESVKKAKAKYYLNKNKIQNLLKKIVKELKSIMIQKKIIIKY
jgi:hypothetical protein